MGAAVGSLPGLGTRSHLGGTAFGATAHGAVHGAFMTLPPYTKSREGEVQEQGFGVSNGAHPVRSRPVEASSERMERACPAMRSPSVSRFASFVGNSRVE